MGKNSCIEENRHQLSDEYFISLDERSLCSLTAVYLKMRKDSIFDTNCFRINLCLNG